VLLAVSGGIAAYKIPELVRQLRGAGHEVRCVLTRAALEFVSPLTLQTLSQHAVRTELFDPGEEGQIDNIALANWGEVVVVAPATANLLAKMAIGIADDLVTTMLLATRAPVLVAPAMNVNMWRHAATQANLATLRDRGIRFVGPESGPLACGEEGVGRMAEPDAIAAVVQLLLGRPSLAAERVLVTAGAPESPSMRFAHHHRSSGKDGLRWRPRQRCAAPRWSSSPGLARCRRPPESGGSTWRRRSRCARRCWRNSAPRRWR
jgi:phosphopantothenoylcysteine decarboxylase/phosphopantothenate--cysteine ligase